MVEEITEEMYADAYVETLEILKYLSEEEYKKIPPEVIELFEENSNEDYEFEFDVNKTVEEQNIQELTRYILAEIFVDYLATEEQKIKLEQKRQYFLQQKEKEAQELYNPENLFKKKDNKQEETQMIVYKESIFKKIFNKIKNFFKK